MSTSGPRERPDRGDGIEPARLEDGSTARILVIDDETGILAVARRALRAHHVVTAGDARQALRMLETASDFDLVLCDIGMPGMNGLQFWSEIALAHPHLVDRIVFMTGGVTSAEQDAFLSSGAVVVLRKPFTGEALGKLVASRLGDRRR